MAGDQHIGGSTIPPLLPTPRKLLLLAAFKHLVSIDCRCISAKIAPIYGAGGAFQTVGHDIRSVIPHLRLRYLNPSTQTVSHGSPVGH
jgi:hypothetical protein